MVQGALIPTLGISPHNQSAFPVPWELRVSQALCILVFTAHTGERDRPEKMQALIEPPHTHTPE